MSNATIIERIKATWHDFSLGKLTLLAFIDDYRRNVVALEGLPYPLIVEARRIADVLEVSAWAVEEDCVVDTLPALASLTAWVSSVQKLEVLNSRS
ncbi:hypothetical protein [Rhizobium sp. ZW T2_16]|uniref:hypothetical protein n=1 Tax=Rhizobium sp. ZW T2_16 TaxID=3378083 RepID=UPI00385332B2